MSEALMHPSIGTAALSAILGYAVVFFGIILLLVVVSVMSRIMVSSRQKAAPAAEAAPAVPAAEPAPRPEAKGTAGEVKLYDVPDKEAALIMAVVACQMQRPINELRFRSIKEVKES